VDGEEVKDPDDGWDGAIPGNRPPPPLKGDINFEETPGGFEIWYSDRIATEHQDLVNQSADYLEDELGLIKLRPGGFQVSDC
jgi:hypothetical protein